MNTPTAEDCAWLAVGQPAMAASVRRAAVAIGREAGLNEAALGDLAIVTMEIATNVARHADDGVVVLRLRRVEDRLGVEIVALDRGPGMADVDMASLDGHSTAGTLGIGLGAIRRMSSDFDAYSRLGSGTVLTATIWDSAPLRSRWFAGLTRPIQSETVCGDAYAVREFGGRRQLMMADGLGHGALAAVAAQTAVAAFAAAAEASPKRVLEQIHSALSHTRGAVVGVAEIEPRAGTVRYAGIGNISATIGAERRRVMVSLPGIAGHQARDVREFEYEMDGHDFVVLHSDGLTDRWRLSDYPGIATHSPMILAATLMRDAGKRRDDAAILVAGAR